MHPHYYYPATYDGFFKATLEFPLLWWIVGGLAVISFLHDRRQRSTVAEYARRRVNEGATDTAWPDSRVRWALFVNPALLLTGALGIGLIGLLGWLVEFFRTDPFHRMPGYEPLPASMSALVAATCALVISAGLQVLAARGLRSPHKLMALRIRSAIYAKPEKREALFAEALALDPGLSPMAPEPTGGCADQADA